MFWGPGRGALAQPRMLALPGRWPRLSPASGRSPCCLCPGLCEAALEDRPVLVEHPVALRIWWLAGRGLRGWGCPSVTLWGAQTLPSSQLHRNPDVTRRPTALQLHTGLHILTSGPACWGHCLGVTADGVPFSKRGLCPALPLTNNASPGPLLLHCLSFPACNTGSPGPASGFAASSGCFGPQRGLGDGRDWARGRNSKPHVQVLWWEPSEASEASPVPPTSGRGVTCRGPGGGPEGGRCQHRSVGGLAGPRRAHPWARLFLVTPGTVSSFFPKGHSLPGRESASSGMWACPLLFLFFFSF